MSMDLSGLKDIHLPIHEVSMFPLAIGWWILILFPLIVFAIIKTYKYILNKSIKIYALRELMHINKINISLYEKVLKISMLLKRVAIKKFGRTEVANLYGDEWAAFIKKRSAPNDEETIRLIVNVAYSKSRGVSKENFARVNHIAKNFIRQVL